MAKKKTFIRMAFRDMLATFVAECRTVFHDSGVMVILFVAGILYPLLYNVIYRNEVVEDMPIAVVDRCNTADSRRFLRKLDATDEVAVARTCTNLEEAERLMTERKVHGVLLIPSDYSERLAHLQQATISSYEDMSSFLYYKNMVMATNFVMLDEGTEIQIKRYDARGITGEQGAQLVSAMPYEDCISFNPGSGFSSFFLPAVLILIIQQTMFFGIGMVAGTQREQNRNMQLVPERLRGRGIGRIVMGKAAAYILIYAVLTAYIIGIVPAVFNMPHLGDIWQLFAFIFPFLLACVFFSLMLSVLIRDRETGLVLFLFFTLILLFLSGFSWPQSNIPAFWKGISYLFPSTFGIQGYIKMNSTGATLSQVRYEFMALWFQTIAYFIGTCAVMAGECKLKERRAAKAAE